MLINGLFFFIVMYKFELHHSDYRGDVQQRIEDVIGTSPSMKSGHQYPPHEDGRALSGDFLIYETNGFSIGVKITLNESRYRTPIEVHVEVGVFKPSSESDAKELEQKITAALNGEGFTKKAA